MPNNFPPVSVYPNGYDSDQTLFLVHNTSETVTTTENMPWSSEIAIAPVGPNDPEIWATNGFANIDGELFYYDNVGYDANQKINSFKNCCRNLGGTHTKHCPAGAEVRGFVIAEHHNQLTDAIIKIEEFIGENFSSDKTTLDYRIRNLQQLPVIFDDFTCPDVNFSFSIISEDPAGGITAQYSITITGTYTSYRLDFGDGEFTTSSTNGTHQYATNSIIDPIITISNSKCTIVQSPIQRTQAKQPTPQTVPAPFEIPVPVIPDLPAFNIPTPIIPSNINVLPPIVFPCLSLAQASGIIIPSIIVIEPPISIPSIINIISPPIPTLISIVPPVLPTQINFGPVIIPTLIRFGPVNIPTLIRFGPVNIPTLIRFGPVFIPTLIRFGPVNIPSIIEVKGGSTIPPSITFGPISVPSLISITPVSIPSLIVISPVFIPTLIEITPVNIPTSITIYFDGGYYIPDVIYFGPVGTIPTLISFGPIGTIPTLISFGPVGNIPTTISFTNLPSIPSVISFTACCPIPSAISFTNCCNIPSAISFVNPVNIPSTIQLLPPTSPITCTLVCPSTGPTFRAANNLDVLDGLSENLDTISIDVGNLGIPSQITVKAPEIPDINVLHDIPAIIRIESITIPDIKIIGPENPIPTEIRVVSDNLFSTIELSAKNVPSSIMLDASNVPQSIKLEIPDILPTIKIDATGIPDKIQVVGIPSAIELIGAPSEIKLVMPENPEIELVYKGAPIDVKVNLDINRLTGEGTNSGCVAIVPCNP